MNDDLISRAAAIDALVKAIREDPYYDGNEAINGLGVCDVRMILNDLPSAQPSEIQDILNYLDTVLHPIISPEHWNVYSELHDMISSLPERKRGKWVSDEDGNIYCSVCGRTGVGESFCEHCGANMKGEEE